MTRSAAEGNTLQGFSVAVAFAVVLSFLTSARAQEPPAPLARYFPNDDLVVYAEFDGLDAHARAWKASAAFQLLNETKTGVMLETVAEQFVDSFQTVAGNEETQSRQPSGATLLKLSKHALRSGFAFGICRNYRQPKPACVGLVVRGAGKGEMHDELVRLLNPGKAQTQTQSKPGGRCLEVVEDTSLPKLSWAWWTEGDDLAISLVSAQGADAMIEALDGKRPSALAHPLRAELAKRNDAFEPIGLAFFEMAALANLPDDAAAYGLDRIKRIDYRLGLQEEAFVTITRLAAPEPRSGIVGLLDQPRFNIQHLPPLPKGASSFTVISIDVKKYLDTLVELLKVTDPHGRRKWRALEESVHKETGERLREDILRHLGPKFAYFRFPSSSPALSNPLTGLAAGWLRVPEIVLMCEIDDAQAVKSALDGIVKAANRAFHARPEEIGAVGTSLDLRPLKSKQGEHGYSLAIPPSQSPLSSALRPTVAVGKSHLVFATTPAAALRALALEAEERLYRPALGNGLKGLSSGLTFLSVSDPRDSLFPEIVSNLPQIAQQANVNQFNTLNMFGMQFGIPQMLANFGVPMPAPALPPQAFQIRIDPDDIPSAEDVRAHLFPSTVAMSADAEGFQLTTREALPSFDPRSLVPVAMALAPPLMQLQQARLRDEEISNSLRAIGSAIQTFNASERRFPPPFLGDKNGKPLLSWRVTILPLLGEQELFNAFKLDEPWDSAHNKDLIAKMPAIFKHPLAEAEAGMTFYRAIVGAGAFFDESIAQGRQIESITDGTSNTLCVVEARDPVVWTRPDVEIPFNPNDRRAPAIDKARLGGHVAGGFHVLLADGTARFLNDSIKQLTLQAMCTVAGGEVLDASQE
jgi:hypothetical protein